MLLSAVDIGKALLNTLMGMGTVFIVLIFISWLIGMFKYLNRPAKKVETPAAEPVNNVVTQIEEREELSDDAALVAVITAAVAAYEEASGAVSNSGFRVRSIKRANGSNRSCR